MQRLMHGCCGIIGSVLCLSNVVAQEGNHHNFQASIRFAHYDRDFANQKNDRVQNGVGIALSYQSPQFLDYFRIGASYQLSQPFLVDGQKREDVFAFDGQQVTNHHFFGEAYLEIHPTKTAKLTIGRQTTRSMFLYSKTRVLPTTFRGLNMHWVVTDGLALYGSVFDQWSRRANGAFEAFDTAISTDGAINYIAIAGGEYTKNQLNIRFEYLHVHHYLNKWAVKQTYAIPLTQSLVPTTFNMHLAAIGLSSAGSLFAIGADPRLDVAATAVAGTAQQYRSVAGYVGISLANHTDEVGIYYTQFSDLWLERNFAGDHGANPFPGKTIGPDLTNKHEQVWMLEYKKKWQSVGLPNLKTRLAFAHGSNIENTVSQHLGQGHEYWVETDIKYTFATIPALKTRLRYRVYRSEVSGVVNGIRQSQNDLRFTVDYQYTF